MIEYVDIVYGASYGDESKAKITHNLASQYDLVARWAGGNNAGHTVYVEGKKYKAHSVPVGIFSGTESLIGPGCVLHPSSFFKELEYLKDSGFDTSLVKVYPNCHIITDEHIRMDLEKFSKELGTTGKGIGPAYSDKYLRVGKQAKDILDKNLLWNKELKGKILCEGAQGAWLDIDLSPNYPYVTSSTTLPYGACSLGFPPQFIRKIYAAAKAYDTKSGVDPNFPDSLLEDPILLKLADLGQEFGTTTGRRRKVNWLNCDWLIKSLNIAGATDVIISKWDVLLELQVYKVFINNEVVKFNSINDMQTFLQDLLLKNCLFLKNVTFSSSPEII